MPTFKITEESSTGQRRITYAEAITMEQAMEYVHEPADMLSIEEMDEVTGKSRGGLYREDRSTTEVH